MRYTDNFAGMWTLYIVILYYGTKLTFDHMSIISILFQGKSTFVLLILLFLLDLPHSLNPPYPVLY